MTGDSNRKKRVVLAFPPYKGKEPKSIPPLGLMYIASCIRDLCDVHILDFATGGIRPERAASICLDQEPDVIGVSSKITNYAPSLDMCRRIREESPSTTIVLGGAHPSCLAMQPEYPLDHDFPADIVVLGEGELTMRELVSGPLDRDPRALGTLCKLDGRWKRHGPRPLVPNLDVLPFPSWDLIPTESYFALPRFKERRFAIMMTSRGCPNGCSFCTKAVFGRNIRFRSSQNVMDEVRMLTERLSIDELVVYDDNFAHDKERALQILGKLSNEDDLSLRFENGLRVDTLDDEVVKALADAGTYYIGIGIESGDPSILSKNRKRLDLEHAKRVVKLCRDHSILTKAYFILGLPGETRGSIERTKRYLEELQPDLIAVGFLCPFPSTPAFMEATESGSFTDAYPIDSKMGVNWIPPGLDAAFMTKSMRDMYTSFCRPTQLAGTFSRVLACSSHLELISMLHDGMHMMTRMLKNSPPF